MKIRGDFGTHLDATVAITLSGDTARIVMESRGPSRNVDYIPAFALLLRRLKAQRAVLVSARVASVRARMLPEDEQRLLVEGAPMPLPLEKVSDIDALAGALRAAAAKVGRAPDLGRGGNSTKRLELTVCLSSDQAWDVATLEQALDLLPEDVADRAVGVTMQRTEVAGDGDSRHTPTYLLTWNPSRFPVTSFKDELRSVVLGDKSWIRWSSGNTKRIPAGARIFLLRQGPPPRGIIADGWIIEASHEAPHWDEARRTRGDKAWFVGLAFETILPLESGTPLDLGSIDEGPLATVNWSIPASGTRLPPAAAALLETLWTSYTQSAPTTEPVVDEAAVSALEGIALQRLVRHRTRERALRSAKLHAAIAESADGRIRCEVPGCGFDFEATYGALGAGFAHVHHRRPLASLDTPERVSLADLAVVCANCHAIIHRNGDCRPLEGLILTATQK